MLLLQGLGLLFAIPFVRAQITVYGQLPLGQTATTAAWATTTVLAAYNDTRLTPPQPPVPASTNFNVALQKDAAAVPGLSIPHVGGGFFGFSIEMSVISQVLGKNSSFIQVPFLNLMANLAERAGSVVVRLGGNTQEFAILVDSSRVKPGHTFGKALSGTTQTTLTPAVLYTMDMFYMMNNISNFVPVKWFLGIPFNDSVNWRLEIAEHGQQILGDNLLGLQAGNEPDFYQVFGRRVTYTPPDYFREFGELCQAIDNNPNIPRKNILIGPSVSGQVWHPEAVWDTGFIPTYKDRLVALSVEHYPRDNCVAMYGGDPANFVVPQRVLANYLDHSQVVSLVQPYVASTALAVAAGKPFIMFETNTGSCGGFSGISDTFTSAMWALDYGLQMASVNFTHALLHIGGQNVFYNPFTAPPTNQTEFNQWTVGPIFYSVMIIAEALGKSNTSQVIDLGPNNGDNNTPGYAIYEQGTLSKVALFNYMDDASGAHDLTVAVSVSGATPASVQVKYFHATSVVDKTGITWAGQTFGNKLTADGRLRGALNVTTINCDQANNVCRIPVPAPGFALVLMNGSEEAATVSQSPHTYSTSAHVKPHNTVTYDPAALATSNGHAAANWSEHLGGTNYGNINGNGAMDVRLNLFGKLVLLPCAAAILWCLNLL